DPSGSLVVADKPVEVLGGNTCAFVPQVVDMHGSCDHLEESVLPLETLGSHYFVAAPSGPEGGVAAQVVRFYGNVDGTTLTYPAGIQPPQAPTTIGAGQVVDLGIVDGDFEVQGDHEFAVATWLLTTRSSEVTTKGDPAQSAATPVEQYRTSHVFGVSDDFDV